MTEAMPAVADASEDDCDHDWVPYRMREGLAELWTESVACVRCGAVRDLPVEND